MIEMKTLTIDGNTYEIVDEKARNSIPTKTSDLENNSGFITAKDIPEGGNVDLTDYYTKQEIDNKGFITAGDISETPAATDEQVKNAVDEYLAENPVGSDDFTLKEEFNNPHKYPNAQPTPNLFNPDGVTYGYYIVESTGKLATNASYCVTDFIPVLPSTNYITSLGCRYAYYDSEKNYISGAKSAVSGTSPENAKYIRISPTADKVSLFMLVQGNTVPLNYIPYQTRLPWLVHELPEMTAHDFAFDGGYKTVNLFNKYAAEDGYYVDEATGRTVSNSNHTITPFLKITPNVTLKGNKGTRICFYDELYRFISGGRLTNPDYTIIVPETATYVRMSDGIDAKETVMVVEGDTIPQIYVPYGVTIPWLHSETKISKYHGKKMVCLGDSITYGGYNTVIAEDTGIETINAGFSSARYAHDPNNTTEKNAFALHNIIDAICTNDWTIPNQIIGVEGFEGQASQLENLKTVDFSTVDFVSFAYGTNDFGSGTPYADSDNPYDINTVSGAVRYAIKTLQTAYPHIRIIVSLPIYRFWATDGVVTEDSDTKDYGGGTLPEYCGAIKKAAQDMKIPVIDLYHDGGINEFNRLNYFNITDGTHPNSKGSAVIGHGIAEGVLRYL